jgi:hypothetical protein
MTVYFRDISDDIGGYLPFDSGYFSSTAILSAG